MNNDPFDLRALRLIAAGAAVLGAALLCFLLRRREKA